MFWPLMKDCFTEDDRKSLVDFIQSSTRYTNGPKVVEFEKKWSEWLGVDYSLFVSSGSTANLLLMSAVITKFGLKKDDKVLVPAMTWVTNVSPIIQLGLKPIFCDVDTKNFGFNMDHLKKLAIEHDDIKVIFVTHLFGIPAPIEKFKEFFPKAIFLEDCCESHGAEINGKKVGNFSLGSTFSSYFGHHMTTVEGGFVSTNDNDLYELMRAKRSHGMARECSPDIFEKYIQQYPEVDKRFMFVTDGYNFRNTEFGAVIGLSQLLRLDSIIERRREICLWFKNYLKKHENIFDIPEFDGNSSFCLPFILKDKDKKTALQNYLEDNGIETRPLCSGNLLRQPFLKNYSMDVTNPEVDYLHFHGFFIGNNHLISESDISQLEILLDNFLK